MMLSTNAARRSAVQRWMSSGIGSAIFHLFRPFRPV
jgi:hypothetical protein